MASASGTEPQPLNILLLGKTGSGKSSLANTLTGTNEFKVGYGMTSETQKCKCVRKTINGCLMAIVDTPGTMDTDTADVAMRELCDAMTYCRDGFDACLLVVRPDVRFTTEEKMAVELLAKAFGPDIYKYIIVVFSHGDQFDNNIRRFRTAMGSQRRKVSYLDSLLNQCGNWMVLVDNGGKCTRRGRRRRRYQIKHLLAAVRALSQSHQGKLSDDYFRRASKYFKEEYGQEERKQQERVVRFQKAIDEAILSITQLQQILE